MYDQIYKNILFPFYEKAIKGRKTTDYIEELEQNQWLHHEQIEHKQWDALKLLLNHAYKNCDYYKRVFNGIGIRPNDLSNLNDFQKLPIIGKEEIRENLDDMIAKNYCDDVFYKSTGGSTGVPLKLAYNSDSYDWRIAASFRGYTWAGCQDGKKVVYIWGIPIGDQTFRSNLKVSLHNAILRRTMINSFAFDQYKMQEAVNIINRVKPEGMVGYTTPLYNLCQYIKKNGLKVRQVKSIVTGAEKVEDYQRELIEEVFKGKVFNTYGSREFMLIAAECEEHNGLHVQSDHVLVEILKDGQPVAPGEKGEIVITDLHNYGMPIIRYAIGDLAVASDRVCACKRGLPLIENIEGRILDTIQTVDGKFVPGEFFPHLMKEFEEVKKFQVIQMTKMDLEIKMVTEQPLTEEQMQFLSKEVKKVLGDKINIEYNFVKDIPLTQSGKYRVTISNVPVDFGNKL